MADKKCFHYASKCHWKSVPVNGSSFSKLNDININNPDLFIKKLKTQIKQNTNYEYYEVFLKSLFEEFEKKVPKTLFDLNFRIIDHFIHLFKIKTKIITSSQLKTEGKRDQKIINLLNKVGATCYVAAPGSRTYIEDFGADLYAVDIKYFDYPKSVVISEFYDGFGYENSLQIVNRLGLEKVMQNVFK